MSEQRDTDPDPRSPYEHVLGELLVIKSLCEATHTACVARVATVERWQLVNTLAAFAGFILGACAFAR